MKPRNPASDAPPQRSLAASTKAEWFVHIKALGLNSVDQYRRWCRRHDFPFNRKKTWRQERAELRIAALERSDQATLDHIHALDLKTVEQYQDWCRRHGFRDRLNKKVSQRQKELIFFRRTSSPTQQTPNEAVAPSPTQATTPDGPAPVDQSLTDHLAALGLANLEAYRLWCRQNGFDPALQKSPAALVRERATAVLRQGKRQQTRMASFIRAIAAGDQAGPALQTRVLQRIKLGFDHTPASARPDLERLLLHLEGHSELLQATPGVSSTGRQPGTAWIDGVIALAQHSDTWTQTPETWSPTGRLHSVQFSALARHLLARYPIPTFMDAVFFVPDPLEAARQQEWFKHMGRGGNIRTADTPVLLSKKMAHHLQEAPPAYTPLQAMRWGQACGFGCNRAQTEALCASFLGKSAADEDFWQTVVQFIGRCPLLPPEKIKPIVNYIAERKFPQEAGEEAPEPNFSMKSRSLPKLIRQVERWQAAWEAAVRLSAEPEEKNKQRRHFSHYYAEEHDAESGRSFEWTIQELGTARSLAREGDAMRHCVADYSNQLGRTSLWSLQVREEGRTHRVLTIAIDIEKEAVSQVRGRFNADPETEVDATGAPLAGPVQAKGRLNRVDRDYLRRSTQVLRAWLKREGIYYFKI
jgi:hypothetical protein